MDAGWSNVLYSWAPILMMIGFWIYIMRRVGSGKQAVYMERSIAFMDRQEQLLERIASALEKRTVVETDEATKLISAR